MRLNAAAVTEDVRIRKVYSYLGLATKAGKLSSGEFLCEKTIKSKEAALTIVASDASDNTKKMFRDMCTYYNVPYALFGTKEELGHHIGKEFRASLVVKDAKFAQAILAYLTNEDCGTGNGGSMNEDIRTGKGN